MAAMKGGKERAKTDRNRSPELEALRWNKDRPQPTPHCAPKDKDDTSVGNCSLKISAKWILVLWRLCYVVAWFFILKF